MMLNWKGTYPRDKMSVWGHTFLLLNATAYNGIGYSCRCNSRAFGWGCVFSGHAPERAREQTDETFDGRRSSRSATPHASSVASHTWGVCLQSLSIATRSEGFFYLLLLWF